MVSRFEKITQVINKKHKDASLLAFVRIDEGQDTWTILFSSPLISYTGRGDEIRKQVFADISKALNETQDETPGTTVVRVGIFPLDRHIIKDALKFKAGTHITEPTRMNGNTVFEGYITISKSN